MPGTSTTYTIVVSNAGPSTAVAQQVTDFFPAAITAVSWTAVASAGSSVAAASGTGNIADHRHPAARRHRHLHRRRHHQPGGHRLVDQHRHGGRAARGHHPGQQQRHRQRQPDPQTGLAITKTDGQTTAPCRAPATTYTIAVSNAGPSDAARARAVRPPAGRRHRRHLDVRRARRAAAASAGPLSGSGALATTVNLPVGATVTFSFTVLVDPTATGTLVNTATVTPPGGRPASGTDTDALTPQADLSVTKTDGKASRRAGHARHLHHHGQQRTAPAR